MTDRQPRSRPRRRGGPAALALLGSVVLVAGACGGGGDDPAATGGDRPATGEAAPTTGGDVAPGGGEATAVRLVRQDVDVEAPIDLVALPGTASVLVAERPGRVRLATVVDGGLRLRDEPVLDLGDRVSEPEGERGLLGLAVAPDGSELYVNYTEAPDGDTRVDAYRLTGRGTEVVADAGSRRELLAVEQPYPNHNGGALAVGPDGMLYVGMGDGGAADDPEGRAQDPTTLLGKLVRLDPAGVADADGDGVPDDNPFLEDPSARPEIWATGLRNPWRFSFDPATGDLWVADVGQDRLEEVNVVPPEGGAPAGAGANFGWDLREGDQPFADPDPTEGWSDGPFVEPVLTYPHDDGACSVTGGVVVRDPALPALAGWYLHGDFCRPGVRALGPAGADGTRPEATLDEGLGGVVAFGTGPGGEVYVLSLDGGIHRLTPA